MDSSYDIEDFDYFLPEEKIAQEPSQKRDASKLLVLDCKNDTFIDRRFEDLVSLLNPKDLLVVNDTKVFPARLLGKKDTGGKVEVLVLQYPHFLYDKTRGVTGADDWEEIPVLALIRSSKRPGSGRRLIFGPELEGIVEEHYPDGKVKILLRYKGNLDQLLAEHGSMPLPPYIRRVSGEKPEDRKRYQTVYAKKNGAVAAPTAGLHFTEELLKRIRDKGVGVTSITLHVGYGTFAPVRVDDIRKHNIHAEYVTVTKETAKQINGVRSSGGSIWAVGTTTARALEFAASEDGEVRDVEDWCDLYIFPGYRFKVVKNLITNFHLPRSSLLFLVSALAGQDRIKMAYQHAVNHDYRFYSYGDAMAIVR